MKTLFVVFSLSGRTLKAGTAMAEEMEGVVNDFEWLRYDGKMPGYAKEQDAMKQGDISHLLFNRQVLDLSRYDRIVFGTPTHGSRPAAAFHAFLANCKNTAGKEWVLFATCRTMAKGIFDVMRAEIEKTGGKVTQTQLFKWFIFSHPEQAKAFGRSLEA